MKKHFSIVAVLLLGSAVASHNTQDFYIVNPYETSLQVDVWLDQSGHTPSYFPGESIQIYTKVNQDAYVYLFNVDPSGRVDLILPNQYTPQANYVQADETVVFPGYNSPYAYQVAPPYGLNQIIALASKTPLDLEVYNHFSNSSRYRTAFASDEQNFVNRMSQVLDFVPDQDWVTSTSFYNVSR